MYWPLMTNIFSPNHDYLDDDLSNPQNNQLYNDNSFLLDNDVKSDDLNNYDILKDYHDDDDEEFEKKSEEEDDLFQIKGRETNINIDDNSKQKNYDESEKKFIDIPLKFNAKIINNKSTKDITKNNDNTLNSALELKEKTTITKKRKIINKQNMGCKKKTERITNYDINEKNGPHHKGKTDNIDIKLKRAYLKYLTLFINVIIGKIPKMKNKGKLLQLNKKIINNMKKQHILKFFDSTAKEYLSQEISEKCKRYKKDNNKTLIKYIYDINEVTLISVLEKTNRELWKIFCKDTREDNIFQYFDRLSDYIKNDLVKEENTDEYIKKFMYRANNFEEEFKKKHERNQEYLAFMF